MDEFSIELISALRKLQEQAEDIAMKAGPHMESYYFGQAEAYRTVIALLSED